MTLLLLLQLAVPLGLDTFIPAPESNPVSPEMAALGRKLFFDPALSRDRTVSCSTCHDPQRAFTDPHPVAEGIGLRREMRQLSSGTVTVRRKLVGKRAVVVEDGCGSGSGGRLCWRATCQGIHCWKLILMSHSESGVPLSGALRLAASG